MSGRKPVVVIVEDDFVDVEILTRSIKARGMNCEVRAFDNAESALEFLRSDTLSPGEREKLLVFLDINMPGMNGHQFLSELREDESLRRTIVFVLTTSDHPRDKKLAYDRNVAGYFVKNHLEGLLDTVESYADNVEFPPAT